MENRLGVENPYNIVLDYTQNVPALIKISNIDIYKGRGKEGRNNDKKKKVNRKKDLYRPLSRVSGSDEDRKKQWP